MVVCCGAVRAPAHPPVEFEDLYGFLGQDLDAFDRTLRASWAGKPAPVTFAAELHAATCTGCLET